MIIQKEKMKEAKELPDDGVADNIAGRIADFIVSQGTQNTDNGNWCVYFDEIEDEFGDGIFDTFEGLKEQVEDILNNKEEVADLEVTDDCFDTIFYLAYCPNIEDDGWDRWEVEPSRDDWDENESLKESKMKVKKLSEGKFVYNKDEYNNPQQELTPGVQKMFVQHLRELSGAFAGVLDDIESLGIDFQDWFTRYYPFEKSFDEQYMAVSNWADSIEAAFEGDDEWFNESLKESAERTDDHYYYIRFEKPSTYSGYDFLRDGFNGNALRFSSPEKAKEYIEKECEGKFDKYSVCNRNGKLVESAERTDDLDTGIKDETETIDLYDDFMKKDCFDETDKKLIKGIRDDEKDHRRILRDMKAGKKNIKADESLKESAEEEIRYEYEQAYVPGQDMTIIVKWGYKDGDNYPTSKEIVGFYQGEPNDEDNEYYKDKGVKWEESLKEDLENKRNPGKEITRYSDVYDDDRRNKGWWYLVKHGVQPGSLPKDLNVLQTIELPNHKTYVKLDGILNTSELKKYEIKEEVPPQELIDESLKESKIRLNLLYKNMNGSIWKSDGGEYFIVNDNTGKFVKSLGNQRPERKEYDSLIRKYIANKNESLKESKTPYGDTTIEDYVNDNFNGSEEAKKKLVDFAKKKATGKDYFNGLNMSAKDWEREAKKFGLSRIPHPVEESANTKVNIRESLNKIDWDTDNKYDLRNMYDSAIGMKKDDKIKLAKMISMNESYRKMYEYLKKFI